MGWCTTLSVVGVKTSILVKQLQHLRFKQHTDGKHPNYVTEHTSITGYKYTLAEVKVLVKEDSDCKRKVKEAITSHKNNPALNRDQGHKIPIILL